MQLFARDNDAIILASDAKKHKNYRCPECSGLVRIRIGLHRRPHFFHLRATPNCRGHLKTLAHLNLQLHLFDILPKGEVTLERHFPSISRIADVCWESAKIVFEIQCSPLSTDEARRRCLDYKSQGLIPVWILSDQRFNKKYLSGAEHYLRSSEFCFYFKADSLFIYDQFEVCKKGKRLYRSKWLPVDLTRPFKGSCAERQVSDPLFRSYCENREKECATPAPSLPVKAGAFYLNFFSHFLESHSKNY